MANTIKVSVVVSDNGSLQLTTKSAQKVQQALEGVTRAANTANKALSVGQKAINSPSRGGVIKEGIDYRNSRGVAGTGGGDSRDFAKQAQGLGGLVRLYATFAANIFAVTAAFTALDNAAKFETAIAGAKALEAETGAALRSIATEVKNITDGALSLQESLKLTALGTSAGISAKNIELLVKGAKGASLALGRDLSDSIDRVIRGVAKLEPELLDELGVTSRAEESYRKYARAIGISATELTSFQKSQAFTIAVADELNTKFGAISDTVEANPYTKLAGQLRDTSTELLVLVNKVVGPVVKILADNSELVLVSILAIIKSLTVRALPEIGKLFSVDESAIAQQKATLDKLRNQTEVALAKQRSIEESFKNEKLKSKREELAQLQALQAKELALIKNISKQAFPVQSGSTASKINKASSLEEIQEADLSRGFIAKSRSIEGRLSLATDPTVVAKLNAEKDALDKLIGSIRTKTFDNNKLLEVQKAIRIEEGKPLPPDKLAERSKLRVQLLQAELAQKKLNRAQELEQAIFIGQPDDQIQALRKSLDQEVRLARSKILLNNQGTSLSKLTESFVGPQNLDQQLKLAETSLTRFNKAVLLSQTTFDRFTTLAISGAKKLGTALLNLIPIAGTLFIAFEVFKFAFDALGLLNKRSEEQSSSFKQLTEVIFAAEKSLITYERTVTRGAGSLANFTKSQEIISTTFNQTRDSIIAQIDVFESYRKSATSFSDFFDGLFGASRFEELQIGISRAVKAAAEFAPQQDKKRLQEISRSILALQDNSKGFIELNRLGEEYTKIADKIANKSANLASKYKDIDSGLQGASKSLSDFLEKSETGIDNPKLRDVQTQLIAIQKILNDETQSFEQKQQILAKLPENLAKLDSSGFLAGQVRAAQDYIDQLSEVKKKEAELVEERKRKLNGVPELFAQEVESALKAGTGIADIKLKLDFQVENNLNEDFLSNIQIFSKVSAAERARIEEEGELLKKKLTFIKQAQKDQKQAEESEKAQRKKDLAESSTTFAASFNKSFIDTIKTGLRVFIDGMIAGLNGIFSISNLFSDGPAIKNNPAFSRIFEEPAPKELGVSNSPIISKLADPFETKPTNTSLTSLLPQQEVSKDILTRVSPITLPISADTKGIEAALQGINNLDNSKNRNEGLRRLFALEQELATAKIQAQEQVIKLQDTEIANSQRIQGFASENQILAKFNEQSKLAELRFAKEAAEVDQKLVLLSKSKNAETTKGLEAANQAKANLENSRKLEIEQLETQKQIAIAAAETAKFNIQITKPKLEELTVAKSIVQNQLQLNSLTETQANTLQNNLQIQEVEIRLQEKLREQKTAQRDLDELALRNQIKQLELNIAVNVEVQRRVSVISALNTSAQNAIKFLEAQINRTGRLNNLGLEQLDVKQLILKAAGAELANLKKAETAEEDLANKTAIRVRALEEVARLEQLNLDLRLRQIDLGNAPVDLQTIGDEARRQADEFKKGVESTIRGSFSAVYSGIDAAIDQIFTKIQQSEKLTIKDTINAFRAAASDAFKQLAADKFKGLVRDQVAKIFEAFGVKTKEAKAEEARIELERQEKQFKESSISKADTMISIATAQLDNLKLLVEKTGATPIEATSAGTGLPSGPAEPTTPGPIDPTGQSPKDPIGKGIQTVFGTLIDKVRDTLNKVTGGLFGVIEKLFSTQFGQLSEIFSSLLGGLSSFLSGLAASAGASSGGGDLFGSILSLGASFFGGGGGVSSGAGAYSIGQNPYLNNLFAKGGVMTNKGSIPLNKYAKGGIANSPQMAIFGEGRTPEAYVPLPDGRSIPVTLDSQEPKGIKIVADLSSVFLSTVKEMMLSKPRDTSTIVQNNTKVLDKLSEKSSFSKFFETVKNFSKATEKLSTVKQFNNRTEKSQDKTTNTKVSTVFDKVKNSLVDTVNTIKDKAVFNTLDKSSNSISSVLDKVVDRKENNTVNNILETIKSDRGMSTRIALPMYSSEVPEEKAGISTASSFASPILQRKPQGIDPISQTALAAPQNSGSVGGNISINIQITDNSKVEATSSSESENDEKNKNKDLKEFSKLITTKVKEEIVNQKRPGGLLYGS